MCLHGQVEGPFFEGQKVAFLIPRSFWEHPQSNLQKSKEETGIDSSHTNTKHLKMKMRAPLTKLLVYLLVQHGLGSVGHDTLGIARLLAVDKDDAT